MCTSYSCRLKTANADFVVGKEDHEDRKERGTARCEADVSGGG